jgi:hypothetical protein
MAEKVIWELAITFGISKKELKVAELFMLTKLTLALRSGSCLFYGSQGTVTKWGPCLLFSPVCGLVSVTNLSLVFPTFLLNHHPLNTKSSGLVDILRRQAWGVIMD